VPSEAASQREQYVETHQAVKTASQISETRNSNVSRFMVPPPMLRPRSLTQFLLSFVGYFIALTRIKVGAGPIQLRPLGISKWATEWLNQASTAHLRERSMTIDQYGARRYSRGRRCVLRNSN
jgi:hypothetical protein